MKERLNKLMNHLGLNAAAFSSEIGVQRSSISHILSGRNQPGFDFMVKVVTKYPEINSEWLLTGKGDMLKQDKNNQGDAVQQKLFTNVSGLKDSNLLKDNAGKSNIVPNHKPKITYVNSIERVILFSTDELS
jgi:plasmid maintenance system antidote protein VapI